MFNNSLERSDWNLLVLAAAEGQRLEPVQLQKALFLLEKAFPEAVTQSGYYNFRPYNYGAFDSAVYEDAERMEHQGLTQITRVSAGWNEYAASSRGIAKAKELQSAADPRVIDYIRRVVAWVRSLSFADLVRAVYNAYPETKVNSIFKDNA